MRRIKSLAEFFGVCPWLPALLNWVAGMTPPRQDSSLLEVVLQPTTTTPMPPCTPPRQDSVLLEVVLQLLLPRRCRRAPATTTPRPSPPQGRELPAIQHTSNHPGYGNCDRVAWLLP